MEKKSENNEAIKTPMLNFLHRVKKWFTRRRCIVLGCIVLLFIFFYNPTKINLVFNAIPENAIATIYINSLSDEWDEAMQNNMIMGSISVILEEDLSSIRSNDNLKLALSALAGEDTVIGAIDVNGDKSFDFKDGDYIAAASGVGVRRRLLELMWRTKYIPGIGDISVTDDGIRYLNFSSEKAAPSIDNLVLAIDIVDGVLCVAYTSNPSDLNNITSRVNSNTKPARVFEATEEPWKLLSSEAIPQNFIVWLDSFDGVIGLSSLSGENIELRVLDVRKTTQEFFAGVHDFNELGISSSKLAAQYAPADNLMLCTVFNSTLFDAYPVVIKEEDSEKKLDNTFFSLSMLDGAYAFDFIGFTLPSVHISTTKQGIKEGDTILEESLKDLLAQTQRTYIDQYNWRKTYLPEFKEYDPILANIKFGVYVEQKGTTYNQGLASSLSIQRGSELPRVASPGIYSVGDMFDFLGEECGSSYFIGYCCMDKFLEFINVLQVNIKLATIFGFELSEENISKLDKLAIIVDKLSEADALSMGISHIDDEELQEVLRTNEVYCLSLNLVKKEE